MCFYYDGVHMDCEGEPLKRNSPLKSISMNATYILLNYQKTFRHCGQLRAGLTVDKEIP